ncbi:MAG TPA: (2Fe-2S) ferredoxin domain-containing protein [Thermoanaerobaculia bacterium]|nr:(2Fe-2S) ferredoxin domain-containing protein [Thermoanaerobaculia bacterium]
MKYPFEKLFLVCTGPRCGNPERGEERGDVIRADLKELNKSLGRKPSVRVCATSCLDLCEHGPNMVVSPEGTVYSHLDRETARAAYHGEMGDAERRPDLELTQAEFDLVREAKKKQKAEKEKAEG